MSIDEAMAHAARLLIRQITELESRPSTMVAPAELTPDEELVSRHCDAGCLAAGVISDIQPPPRLMPIRERFTPVSITGEPLSETVIRERR